jgi:bifunctional non-homologous end joining protein LigD
LKSLSFQDTRIRIADYVEARATELLGAVSAQQLEGIIGKQRDSLYQPGKRTGAWIKHRVNRGQELVIGGYVPGPHGLDSVVVCFYCGKDLIYVARVRNGFVSASRRQLFEKLRPFVTSECPFVNLTQKKP